MIRKPPLFKISSMRNQNVGKILTSLAFLCAAGVSQSAFAQAAACLPNETQINTAVPAGTWTAGTLGPYVVNIGAGPNALTMTYTVTAAQPFTAGLPNQQQHGGLPNVVRAGHQVASNQDNISLSTQTVNFSRPINKFVYVATDIDYLNTATTDPNPGWQDVARGRVNGTVLPTSITAGANHTVDNATGTVTATGVNNCANTDPACNASFNFNINGINSATEEFRTGPNHNGGGQFVGWTSFGFCAPNRSNITIRKVWVNGTVNDAVTITATGLPNFASIANTANETDTSTVQIVNAGSVINFAEAFTTGSAANYNTTLVCTGTSGLAGSTLTVGNSDTDIVCTYTNTKKTATVTLRKSWVNATINNAVNVTATGLTTLASVANTATEIDSGAAQTVNVGSVLTLAETFTTGSAINYDTNLACTGTSGLAGSTLTVGSADTAIVCTYTNTRRTAAITISKTDSKAVTNSGGTNNYVVTVSNAGPSAAGGIVVTDVIGTGLTCPTTNAVVCSNAVNGAICPSGPLTIANLTGAGITVNTLPINGSLQFAYTCNVN